MADLKVGIVVSAIDRITRPMRGMNASVNRTAASLRKLETQRAGVKGLVQLQKRLGSTAQKMHAARLRTAQLGRQLDRTANPTKKLRQQFDQARRTSDRLKLAHSEQKDQLRTLRSSLRGAGIDTRNLAAAQRGLDDRIAKLNRKIARQQGALKQWGRFKGKMGGLARQGAASLGVLGVAAEVFRRTFVTPAAEFERYHTILETIEGSSAKAKRSMGWISKFATTTPFEMDQVTDAFVKLRSYGMEPTGGLLRSLGDTASAMGKPIMQAVEAIADAVTGENERLKEFGVKARTKGDVITYEYTVNNETKTATANARNRAEIQKVLTGIFDSRFAGAMKKQSATWSGMMSNMSDQWLRFRLLVMRSGVFDFLKGKLSGFLDKVNQMAASGELQKLAKQWSRNLVRGLELAWDFGQRAAVVIEDLVSVLKGVSSAVGGWENLAKILIGLKAASVLSPLVQMGAALSGLSSTEGKTGGWLKRLGGRLFPMLGKGLGVALGALKGLSLFMLTNPIGLAITGIAVAAVLIWKYWEPIKGFFKGVWEGVKTYTAAFWEWLKSTTSAVWEGIKYLFLNFHPLGILISNWEPVKGFFKGLWTGVKTAFSTAWASIEEWWKSFSFLEFGKNLMRTLADGILAAPGAVWDALKSALGAVGRLLPSSDAREGPLSRLTRSGRSIITTLGEGVRRAGSLPLRKPLAASLASAAAGLALAAPAAPGPASSSIAAPSSRPSPGPNRSVVVNNYYRITISQQPGEDAQSLADRIIREIKQRQDQGRREELYDEVGD